MERVIRFPLPIARLVMAVALLLMAGIASASPRMLPALSSVTAGEKIALLVGVNEYEGDDWSDLRYALNDVNMLADALEKQGWTVLKMTTNANRNSVNYPSAENIRKRIRGLAATMTSADLFMFYFSGHGFTRQGAAYLATPEADSADLNRTNLPVTDLISLSSRLASERKVFMIDACRNSTDKALVIKKADIQDTEQMSDTMMQALSAISTRVRGAAVITSCREGQTSIEDARLGHGLFTYHIIRGVEGRAAAEGKPVTAGALTQYVAKKFRDDNLDARQTPYFILTGSEEIEFGTGTGEEGDAEIKINLNIDGSRLRYRRLQVLAEEDQVADVRLTDDIIRFTVPEGKYRLQLIFSGDGEISDSGNVVDRYKRVSLQSTEPIQVGGKMLLQVLIRVESKLMFDRKLRYVIKHDGKEIKFRLVN
ncbi:MAG: caspase family protein [Fimbriimonadaceae bacterium]|nr:caspase family protein [Fimbriimonadaceae bacterium]